MKRFAQCAGACGILAAFLMMLLLTNVASAGPPNAVISNDILGQMKQIGVNPAKIDPGIWANIKPAPGGAGAGNPAKPNKGGGWNPSMSDWGDFVGGVAKGMQGRGRRGSRRGAPSPGSYRPGGYPSNWNGRSHSYPQPANPYAPGHAGYPNNSLPSNSLPPNVLPHPDPFEARGITLVNPKKSPSPVHFLLDGRPRSLAPGYSQKLGREPHVVEFDRGGSFGRAEYSVREGTYEFTPTREGWGLFRKTFEVTLNNGSHTHPFTYLVDGTPEAVGPGESRTHTGRHPIVIAFDPGDGNETTRKMTRNGVYKVRVNSRTNLWGLAPVSDTGLVANPVPGSFEP